MTVTYTLTGAGVERPASNERNVTWTVNDRYETKATMIARKPGHSPGLHAVAADGKAAMPDADPDTQSMVERGKKAMAQCGDDQACIEWKFTRNQAFEGRPLQRAAARPSRRFPRSALQNSLPTLPGAGSIMEALPHWR